MVKIKCCRNSTGLHELSVWWVDGHQKTSDFYLTSFQSGESALLLLLIRFVLLLVSLSVLIWALCEGPSPLWLVYLTNWGLMLLCTMNLTGCFVSIMAATKNVPETVPSGELPWYLRWFWLISNITISMCLLITALYYCLLFSPAIIEELGWRAFWFDMSSHGLTSLLALVELFCARTPVYLCHFYQPLGVGLWYALFSALYYLFGGTDAVGNPFIYQVLDWRYPKRTSVIVVISAVAVILIYIIVWALALARGKITTAFFNTVSVKMGQFGNQIRQDFAV